MDEKFEKIYKELVEKNEKTIEEFRNKTLKKKKSINKIILISCLIYIIIIYIINKNYAGKTDFIFSLCKFFTICVTGILFLLIMALILKSNSYFKEYADKYKDIVIKDFIRLFNNNLDYDKNLYLNEDIYTEAEFEKKYSRYFSHNLLTGNINNKYNVSISYIVTDRKTEHYEYYDIFRGLFAKIQMPIVYNSVLYLRRNKSERNLIDKISMSIAYGKRNFEKLRIKLNSVEFEKKFDFYASNKEKAMKFLDKDMVNKLIEIHNKYKHDYEFTIKNNCIYIRFWKVYQLFEPLSAKIYSLDKKDIYTRYETLNYIFFLTDMLVKKINEVDS